MSMLSVLIKDLVEKTTLEDGTYLVAGTTDANKITFLNLVNAIKKKLGAAAQKSVANNLTTAASGTSVLDAYQGKLLSDKIDLLNSTLSKVITYKSYDITLQENAYVSPYSYYLNWYITDDDISKYGMPVSISIIATAGIPTPCAIVYTDEVKKYRCTAVANSPKVTAHVLFLKF